MTATTTFSVKSRTEYQHRDEVIVVYHLTGPAFKATLASHHRNKVGLTSYWVNREFTITPVSVAITSKLSTGEERTRWYSYETTLKNGKKVDVTHYTFGWFFHKEGVSRGVWATLNTKDADTITEIENTL